MDFMKVIDQTVREIKREVNLKVLKVPEIEQKVLDATDDEPWGPHGSALAEIAQATKKFSECQMVMNVLWTRLSETGRNWRYVYKALAVIEYLVANGSERAVDDIIEHTYQISSLAGFEYVEPSGKDLGINVRKKAESIAALLNDKDKIQEARNKAAANRDKYFGLSSTGVTYKSGSASFTSSSSSFQSSDHYGGFSGRKDSDAYKDNYQDRDQFSEEKFGQSSYTKSHGVTTSDKQGNTSKLGSIHYGSKGQGTSAFGASRPTTAPGDSKHGSVPEQSSSLPSNGYDDDFDDFDPRGTSTTKPAAGNPIEVDLFGESLVGDLMDAPSAPKEISTVNMNSSEADLFADAAFVSAPANVEAGGTSEAKTMVDLFASQPASSPAASSTIDFFAAPEPVVQPGKIASIPDPVNANVVDPFAAVPLNNFDGSDLFGAFTSNTDLTSKEATQIPDSSQNNLNAKSSVESKPPPKKDTFQVKSGIWADTLSRGLIDLNISAPKKVSLADVGVVGGLSYGSDEREKAPSTSFYMGRAMGVGSGLGRPGVSPSTGTAASNDFFSNFGNQQ
ncbi:clathrin interactor EPSIN 1 [Diospyros lotus]|uniref:clathrin interactor EPSIN 1 n=1 Tax=Diospyros lotus TaxID=55363 RepID=UPI002255AF92|nr:clathrin interactor EPSIN 1 [Diospyros lotus]